MLLHNYYHGNIRAIHERFVSLLESSNLWSIVESDAYAGLIKLSVLKGGHGDSEQRDDRGVACEYSRVGTIALSYVENDKRTV